MGQKVNPIGIRLGIVKTAQSRWYTKGKTKFSHLVHSDFKIREYLVKTLPAGALTSIYIERPPRSAVVKLVTSRPGQLIGKKGNDLETLKAKVSQIAGVPVHLVVEELRKPDLDSKFVADHIAQQLEKRVPFRRAMKRAVSSTLKAGAKGIKISVSGRLGGAEIARTEWYREGRVPLHTFRADIDYALSEAHTTYGVIGVKVWIYKGDLIDRQSRS